MAEMKKYKLVKILATVAILLSFLAVIVGNPYTVSLVPVNPDEEFEIGSSVVKVIDAGELAKWIIEKKNDFILYDIRPEKDYKEYHIPHSLNVNSIPYQDQHKQKKSDAVIYNSGNRYIIENIKPLIKDLNSKVYLLKNGMSGWMNEVLFPDLRGLNLSKEEINKIYRISSFFGGKPVTDKERTRKKYSREGC